MPREVGSIRIIRVIGTMTDSDWEKLDWLTYAKSLLAWSHTVEESQPLLLLVRHSHREEISSLQEMAKMGTTQLGQRMAVEFGRRIPSRPTIKVLHSFVPRCTETAYGIAEGIESNGGKVQSLEPLFALVGPQIQNLSLWDRMGVDGQQIAKFVNDWYDGEFPKNDMETVEVYERRLHQEVLNPLSSAENGELHIHVTHDLILMGSIRIFSRSPVTTDRRPPYLGGLGIVWNQDRFEVFENGAIHEFPFIS